MRFSQKVLAMAAVTLTSGTGMMQAESERLYLACPGVGVRVAEFDTEAGTLSPPREAVSLDGTGFLAIHPTKPFLYASARVKTEKKNYGGVAAFRMMEDGTLELLNESSAAGPGTCHVSIDGSGGVVFAANYGGGSVASFRIGEDGKLSDAVSAIVHEGSSIHPRQKQPRAHYIQADPSNHHAYAADLGTDEVVYYRINEETAELTPVGAGKLAPGAGPRHFKFSPNNGKLYVLNELDLTVTTFAHDAESGALTKEGSVSVLPEGAEREQLTCAEIRLHPSGQFLVTSQRDLRSNGDDWTGGIGNNSLSVLRIGEDGALSLHATVPAGVLIPRNFNFDPSGRWLLAGGQRSNDIQIFSFDAESGELQPKGEPVACPSPICFEFVPR